MATQPQKQNPKLKREPKKEQKKRKKKEKYISTNIFTCRFNNETLQINYTYRRKKQWECMYCSPVQLPTLHGNDLYVIEMNNEQNRIEGIGKIQINYGILDAHCKVYSNPNINRYIYKGTQHISREHLPPELVVYLDKILFTGKTHSKRGSGIMRFPQVFLRDSDNRKKNVNEFIPQLFSKK